MLVILFFIFRSYTKSFSPEESAVFDDGNLKLEVIYNRPWKKDREIFGGLVPYDMVWRTGANEATSFSTNKEIQIKGKTLKAGKYSIWTIPGPDSWTIIFNSQTGQWGITAKGEANRAADKDVLQIIVPSVFKIQYSKSLLLILMRWVKMLKWYWCGIKTWCQFQSVSNFF